MRAKITVAGVGFVGATVALRIAEKSLGNVVLHDIAPGMPQGKALDIMESACLEGFDSQVTGTNDPADYRDSDIVVITSGVARKPGMSRDDLLKTNASVVGEVAANVRKYAPKAIVIVVSNPLDAMTGLVAEKTGFPKKRVMGMGGVLDSARFRCFLAMELGILHQDVQAMVLGGHGDDMVPLVRYSTVSGIAVEELISKERLDAIVERTRNGGAEIVGLLKTGSAYYAPSSAVTQMVQSIVCDEKRILPCAAWCTGQYGIRDVFVGVPCKLGREGVEQIIELELAPDDLKKLQASARHVRESMEKLAG
ncbi:MAG: malate dehydrogenase [Verrucomicrobiae bacterium]|nr:malate dehydrogenase [Verrucomicrobiae bacterium]